MSSVESEQFCFEEFNCSVIKMMKPRTRSQTRQVSDKRTRGSRKRVRVVVNCDPTSFDFIDDSQPEMESEEGDYAMITKTPAPCCGTSARTRIYAPKANKKVPKPEELSCSQEVQIIEEKVSKKSSSIGKKCVWVSHSASFPTASLSSSEVQPAKSSQESNATEVGVGDDNGNNNEVTEKTTGPVANKTDLKGIPRYFLDPSAFENDPAEKERILKSIYDKHRRDMEMKAKLNQLKQENMQLKRMLLMTSQEKSQNGGVLCGPSPTNTISPTESIFNASVPSQPSPVDQPTPTSQIGGVPKEKVTTPTTAQPLPKRRRQTPLQPRQRKNAVTLQLEKEKEIIQNLYKQYDEDDEDIEAIVAAIQGTTSSSTHSESDATKIIKKKQALPGCRFHETGTGEQCGSDEDEIQIIKEVENSSKLRKLNERYADVIFEEAE